MPVHRFVRSRHGTAALVLITWCSIVVSATFASTSTRSRDHSDPPQISERGAAALEGIQLLFQHSDWDAMAAAADRLVAASPADSYDRAVGHVYRAQAHLARGERDAAAYATAIASIEHVVASGFWPGERVLEWKYQLAQLYLHERRLDDAGRIIESWLAETSVPKPEAYVLLVSTMLEQAQTDSSPADAAAFERALTRVNEGLRLGTRPDETLLYLKAACFQGLKRWDDAAETLEFILSRNPRQAPRWEQLYAMYTSAGRDLPAILTIERARAFGVFDSPRADLALGQHYHSLAQDHRALDALEAGLRRGVDDAGSHWLFAAYLAFSSGDHLRASRLLAAAEPLLANEAQRRDHDRLAEAMAGVTLSNVGQ